MTRSRIATALTALTIAAAPRVPAQSARTAARLATAAPVVIPLQRHAGHLRTIRVRVGGDTADYLFDTGGGTTVISRLDSAALGCTPGGRSFGVRLTGEVLSGRTCANVTLGIGPLEVTGDAGVMDLGQLLGPRAPAVRGLISLASFRGRLLTVDLAHDILVLETPASLAERVRSMTPVDVRLATGEAGGMLDAFVGVRAPGGAELWLEWDSENGASTLLAPYAAAMLGGDSTVRRADLHMPLARGLDAAVPVMIKADMIHDGVLSAGFIERAVWTLDLERGRMWVGPVAPIPELPAVALRSVPPTTDPVGVYETTAMVGGRAQHAILEITRTDGRLTGRVRAVGEDDAIEVRDIAMHGSELSYRVMGPNPIPIHLTFAGMEGEGTWGDGGASRGGQARAVKRM
ncbi:MAG TPA: retropepsin-like aspartic protease [Gemmatimonadaceae bacterium]